MQESSGRFVTHHLQMKTPAWAGVFCGGPEALCYGRSSTSLLGGGIRSSLDRFSQINTTLAM